MLAQPCALRAALWGGWVCAQAVTGDQGGAISVWHVSTGKLRYRFTNTHKGKQLTAINFDSAKRRLLTGARECPLAAGRTELAGPPLRPARLCMFWHHVH